LCVYWCLRRSVCVCTTLCDIVCVPFLLLPFSTLVFSFVSRFLLVLRRVFEANVSPKHWFVD
jgi:hypothetical protein